MQWFVKTEAVKIPQCRDFKWKKTLCVTSVKPAWALRVTQVQLLALCVCTELPGHATITLSHGHYACSGTSVHTWKSWVKGVMLPLQYCSWAVILQLQKMSCCIWASHSFGFGLLWVGLFGYLLHWFSDVPWLLSKSSLQQIQNLLNKCLCCYKEATVGS